MLLPDDDLEFPGRCRSAVFESSCGCSSVYRLLPCVRVNRSGVVVGKKSVIIAE